MTSFSRKSFSNLAALAEGDFGGGSLNDLQGGGPLSLSSGANKGSRNSIDSDGRRLRRLIFVSNHLPLRVSRGEAGWSFEWDEDALIAQAKEGLPDDMDAVYVGCLPVEVDSNEQEEVATQLQRQHNCYPVFLGTELKTNYYRKFCKQQLWPILHYLTPLSPNSLGRFDPDLWSSYVRANKVFASRMVEVLGSLEDDYVWIHDYHLLVLPSLLRKRFHRIKCGIFLHSPFPSSEIFRTFPRREEIIRSMLNADLIGFHTFDYARHFLSCCARMLGLEHKTNRGSIVLEYYGRDVGIKIMPTGVKPERLLSAFGWDNTIWRRGELAAQFKGKTVLIGVDDFDVFKGIELRLSGFREVLEYHPEWRGKLVLIQVTSTRAPGRDVDELLTAASWSRAPGRDVDELYSCVVEQVESINARFRQPGYEPVVWINRPVPLYERIALYSIAGQLHSPFTGVAAHALVRDAIYGAIRMPITERHIRHEKHWKYVSSHTVQFWAKSYVADLHRFTTNHSKLQCFDLGFALDTFRMVALTKDFRKLQTDTVMKAYQRATKRVLLLDHDGTLVAQSSINSRPTEQVLGVLCHLTADPTNTVYIISGRGRAELSEWFASVPNLGLAAEHGFYLWPPGAKQWSVQDPEMHFRWQEIVHPILQVYTESTDGSYIEAKESALVWHYRDADPDFGSWQAKELLDHLEGIISNEPVEVSHGGSQDDGSWQPKELLDHLEGIISNELVEVVAGQSIVEVKPQGVSKGKVVERILHDSLSHGQAPEFVLCIGDDRSDEDMFNAMENMQFSPHMPAEVFACTVGQKPSKAPFYVNDPAEVLTVLSKLGESSKPKQAQQPAHHQPGHVSFSD
ncbi:hypothetical protein N2152v2_000572 [Parachlorella kessleri]